MQRVALRPPAEQLASKIAEIILKLRSLGCSENTIETHAVRLLQARTKPKTDHLIGDGHRGRPRTLKGTGHRGRGKWG
jgi:hypothetical protein